MPCNMITAQELVHEAEKVGSEEFFQLVRNVTKRLSEWQGQMRNLKIRGRLVTFPPTGEAIIVGDLHGNLKSLIHILGNSGFLEKVQDGLNASMIFLGDYGDRGIHSPEVYYVVLRLKETFPENVILMRGNHEGPADLPAYPHDLPIYLRRKFGEEALKIYAHLRELFDYL
ncbi:MAG: metallophosphoesterase, partial [Candidatus Bathyarchaeia archaeon]